jgi:hypothetical protein
MLWPILILAALVLLGGGTAFAAADSTGTTDTGTSSFLDSLFPVPAVSDVGGVMGSSYSAAAQAFAKQEGFGVAGARPTRNNNPGDLRPPNGNPNYWSGQVGVDSGSFAIFATAGDGWAALETDIRVHSSRNPNQTLAGFVSQFAPASDGNNSTAYANGVAADLGVTPDVTLSELFS